MQNLVNVRDEIKAIALSCAGTPTAKLCAILAAAGIDKTKDQAALLGITERAIRKAKAEPQDRGTPVPGNHSSGTTVPKGNHSSEKGTPVPEPQFRSPRAPALMESLRDTTLEVNLDSPLSPPGEPVSLEKGRIILRNGERQDWLKEFGDEQRLQLALDQAANYVQPNSSKPLLVQVRSQLSRLAREKRDRAENYALAAAAKAKPETKRYVPAPAPLPRDEAADERAMRARVKAQLEVLCAGASA